MAAFAQSDRGTITGTVTDPASGRNLLTTQVCNQTVVPKPFAAFPCTGTVAQALRPFPEYNDGLVVFDPRQSLHGAGISQGSSHRDRRDPERKCPLSRLSRAHTLL